MTREKVAGMFWKAAVVQIRLAFDVLDYSGGFSFVVLLYVTDWALLVYSKCSITKITQLLTGLLLFVTVLPLQLQKEAQMLPLWSGQIWYVSSLSRSVCGKLWPMYEPEFCVGSRLAYEMLSLKWMNRVLTEIFSLHTKIQNRRYHLGQQKPFSLWIITVIVSDRWLTLECEM